MTDTAKQSERDEVKALRCLAQFEFAHPIATHRVGRACGHMDDGLGKTRRMLITMAKEGLVEGVQSGARTYWWRITDAGRAALKEAQS